MDSEFEENFQPASDPCEGAIGVPCVDENCTKSRCFKCNKHICPICKRHFKVMIFADSTEGCSTACVKVTHNDTKPWQPPGVKSVIE